MKKGQLNMQLSTILIGLLVFSGLMVVIFMVSNSMYDSYEIDNPLNLSSYEKVNQTISLSENITEKVTNISQNRIEATQQLAAGAWEAVRIIPAGFGMIQALIGETVKGLHLPPIVSTIAYMSLVIAIIFLLISAIVVLFTKLT